MKNIGSILTMGIVLSVLLSITAIPVKAADFIAPSKEDNGTILVSANETYGNLYIAGANVRVNSTINGDIYAVGGMLVINSPVVGDVVVAGGNITINGEIKGDVRAAGGNIIVNAKVGGDLVVAGGTVSLNNGVTIGGDLVANGGMVSIDGIVTGKTLLNGGQAIVDGQLLGPVNANLDSLIIGKAARIPQALNYTSLKPATIQQGAEVPNLQFTERVKNYKQGRGEAAVLGSWAAIKFFAMLVAALILLWVFPTRLNRAVADLGARPWHHLGIGFLVFIVTPIAALLITATVLGLYVGIILLAAYILMLMVSCIIGTVFLGSVIYKLVGRRTSYELNWKIVLLGAIAMFILFFIPVIGWIISAIFFLKGLGLLSRWVYFSVKAERQSPITIA